MRQDEVNIIGNAKGMEVIISPTTIEAALGCLKEGLVFDKDWKREISQKNNRYHALWWSTSSHR